LTFVWNQRECTGTDFHKAALDGDDELVKRLLETDPQLVHRRFTYETSFNGLVQEGSGEAIHLAASRGGRGYEDTVDVLLCSGARLDSWVTRDFQNHYDVFHAAVFAEGKGGTTDMIKHLLDANAELTVNLDGRTPIHMAFQTGAVHLLPHLRQARRERGISEVTGEEIDLDPLLLGIQSGHLSEKELARAAAPTPKSLRTFMLHEPKCIPAFMRHLKKDRSTAIRLAKHVSGCDIAKVMRACPEAASALLDGMTSKPNCENQGLHPLPARISFGPRTIQQSWRNAVNTGTMHISYYKPDTVWRYNGTRFEAPDWHQCLSNRSWGKPVVDAEIQVCYVPNLICADFFAALVASSRGFQADERSLRIFDEPVVRAAIHHAWWIGACRQDLLWVSFSVWGLILLVYDVIQVNSSNRLSVDFIGASGLVQTFSMLARILGWSQISECKMDIFCRDSMYDWIRCVVPMMLPYSGGSRVVHVCVIFIYWWQMLSFFCCSDIVATSILPITRIAHHLIPATTVLLIFYAAFTHAFNAVHEGTDVHWFDTLFSSFNTLFFEELPNPAQTSPLELVLCYAAVTVFSVFLLNIVIGVVSELYTRQKGMAREALRLVRATKCRNFLSCARVLPCNLTSKPVASRIATGACVIAFVAQCAVATDKCTLSSTKYRALLTTCQFAMVLATFQNPKEHWAVGDRDGDEPHYLWIVRPTLPEDRDEDDESLEEGSGSILNDPSVISDPWEQ